MREDATGSAGREVDGREGEGWRAMQQSLAQQCLAAGRTQQAGGSPAPANRPWAGADADASQDTTKPKRARKAARQRGRDDLMTRYFLGASLARNLAGSFSKSGLQLLQQSFTSCP